MSINRSNVKYCSHNDGKYLCNQGLILIGTDLLPEGWIKLNNKYYCPRHAPKPKKIVKII